MAHKYLDLTGLQTFWTKIKSALNEKVGTDGDNANGTWPIGITGNAATSTNATNHIARTDNPHGVTKAQVGLGNVDNTSDIDKPISTATQASLDGKAGIAKVIPDGVDVLDYIKNNLTAATTDFLHYSGSGGTSDVTNSPGGSQNFNVSVYPNGIESSGVVSRWTAVGRVREQKNKIYLAERTSSGVSGWTVYDMSTMATKSDLDSKVDKVTGKGLSTNDYTTAEKNKLDGIEAGANKTVVDAALSSSSSNPVQNKVVKAALDAKMDRTTFEGKVDRIIVDSSYPITNVDYIVAPGIYEVRSNIAGNPTTSTFSMIVSRGGNSSSNNLTQLAVCYDASEGQRLYYRVTGNANFSGVEWSSAASVEQLVSVNDTAIAAMNAATTAQDAADNRPHGGFISVGDNYAISVTIPWNVRTGRASMLFIIGANNGSYSVVQVSWFKKSDESFSGNGSKPHMHVLSYDTTNSDAVPEFYYNRGSSSAGSCGFYLVLAPNNQIGYSLSYIKSMENDTRISVSTIAKTAAMGATSLSSERVFNLTGSWENTPVSGSLKAVTSGGLYNEFADVRSDLNGKVDVTPKVVSSSGPTNGAYLGGCITVFLDSSVASSITVSNIMTSYVSSSYRNKSGMLYKIVNVAGKTVKITGFYDGLSFDLYASRCTTAICWKSGSSTYYFREDV